MARQEEKLNLGKDAAFAKGRFKRLRQKDETWEADFQALPRPITQSETHYLGMVVAPDGSFRADAHVKGRPTVNDMATLLAHAMRQPLIGGAHRPRRLHVRGHPQWRELFPHLDELGIKVCNARMPGKAVMPAPSTAMTCSALLILLVTLSASAYFPDRNAALRTPIGRSRASSAAGAARAHNGPR